MSSIITRPAFEGPHPLATTAPTLLAINEACRQMDMAQQIVSAYIDGRRRGQQIGCSVWRKSIELSGFGKVWKDERGHRVYKRVHVRYGDWAQLDARIDEALAYYASRKP